MNSIPRDIDSLPNIHRGQSSPPVAGQAMDSEDSVTGSKFVAAANIANETGEGFFSEGGLAEDLGPENEWPDIVD